MIDTPLVGRAATLSAIWDDLGHNRAVFVTGESGAGKSRLLREAAARMRDGGTAVLEGACVDIGDAAPLHPVLTALRRRNPGFTVDGRNPLDQVARELGRGRDGVLLVLDDLQWADSSTRRLLLYLLAGLGDVRLSILAAVRAESLQGAHPLRRVLAELRRLRSVRVVDLAPLDRAATGELVSAIAGPEADAGQVFERSGGNPFVAEELARGLRDGRAGLSDTLREIFLSRVDELPGPAHAVVRALAAGVEPVPHELLAEVVRIGKQSKAPGTVRPGVVHIGKQSKAAGTTPLPGDELIEAVRAAMAHHLVTSDDDGYRLRHRLVAEILEQEVLPVESKALHRRYAEALEKTGGDHTAYHWERAGEPLRALPAVIDAARAAERLHGFAEANRHWTVALDLGDDTELLGRAAEAAHRCGEHQLALSRLEELAGRADAPPAEEIHLRRARYLAAAGRSATAELEYRKVPSAAAHLAELLLHLGRYADAGAHAREALALPGLSTADRVRASAALGFSHAFLADPDEGLAVLRKAVRMAGKDDLGVAYLHLAELLTGPLNKLEEGVLVARRGASAGRTHRLRLLAVAANGLFRAGQWAEADRILAEAMRERPSGADAVEILLARCRLWVGFGDVEAAERDLDAVATLLAGGGARHVLPMLTLRAGLAMWQGRHDEARAAVQRGLTETRSDDLVLLGVLAWHGLRAEAEAHCGGRVAVDPQAVRRLGEVVRRMTEGKAAAAFPVRETVDGYLDLCAAELSRLRDEHDPAVWARAATAWDRRNHPYPAAYSRLRQAEALLHHKGQRTQAGPVLKQAYEAAQAMGARPFAAEITAVAGRARITLSTAPAPAPPTELATLTTREHEVLAAVAEGLTNREIGAKLFISERTVGVHVGHIFDKLRVRTRVQASRLFLERESR